MPRRRISTPPPRAACRRNGRWGPQEISLEVNLETRQAYWHRLNVQTIEDEERELNLDTGPDWEWLAQKVLRWAKQGML